MSVNNDEFETTMRKRYRHQLDQDGHEKYSRASALRYRDAGGRRLASLTSQSERDNCDLNILVRRFGVAPLAQPVDPARFSVFDADLDLRTAMQLVHESRQAFASLPAQIREQFRNDPAELVAAIERAAEDDGVRRKLEEIGVLRERAQAPAQPDPPAQPEPSARAGDAT